MHYLPRMCRRVQTLVVAALFLGAATRLADAGNPIARRAKAAARDPLRRQALLSTPGNRYLRVRSVRAAYRHLSRADLSALHGARPGPERALDPIFATLKEAGFPGMDEPVARYLTGLHTRTLAQQRIGRLPRRHAHRGFAERVILLHRAQLHSAEYLQARIDNPTTGPMDHLHAERVGVLAVELGRAAGYRDPETLEMLRVAGHLHDIDRSFPAAMTPDEQSARGDDRTYAGWKAAHADNSAARAFDVMALAAEGRGRTWSSPQLRQEIAYLVRRHEVGGAHHAGRPLRSRVLAGRPSLDRLADIVKDADALAFFEANILTYYGESQRKPERLATKIRFMFGRMSDASKRRAVASILDATASPFRIIARPRGSDLPAIERILLATLRASYPGYVPVTPGTGRR